MPELSTRTQKQRTGDAAEASAARFLEERGLHIIDRAYVRRRGELDLVCVDPENSGIVFVEVRFRRNHAFGGPVASVTPAKANKLRLTARAWLQQHADPRRPARIDVIGISPQPPPGPPAIATHGEYRWEGQHLVWVQSAC